MTNIDPTEHRIPHEDPPRQVQLEGHGRTLQLSPYSYAAVMATAAVPTDLVVSSSASGSLASAHVSTLGSWQQAATRPGGPIEDAGILTVAAGPDGNWRIRSGRVRFLWPTGVILRVPPDNHPGDMLPIYLAKSVDTDEMVTLFGVFDVAPPLEEFLTPHQQVFRRDETRGRQLLEVGYTHAGQSWRQTFYWVTFPTGVVVVKVQEQVGSNAGLAAIADQVQSGLSLE